MLNIAEYQLLEQLHESSNSRVYHVIRKQDGISLILKALNEDRPSPEKRARFQQEYKLMRKLRGMGIAAAYGMESYQGTQVLTLEYFGGMSLNHLAIAGTLSLSEWLALAIDITKCLGQLHRQHVVHKDINPSNIVWNRATGQLKLIDLGNATELARELPDASNCRRLEGTPAYVSPEQTGRMNRAMDYRTDFYSLGVTFYELLTGRLPFTANDILELVHAHIAKMPTPVDQLNPTIPAAVAAIIAKLMGKTAEERYQSAAGLQADLETCQHMLHEAGTITSFPLGRHDFSARLQISQKLYNRASQIEKLLKAFEHAAGGQTELLLVAGYSGIGKTALVHEIQKPVTERRGYFIEGKFEQFKRDIPYAALIQSFTELMRQILVEDEATIQQWKDKLLLALGNNARVITDVIPEVQFIIRPQATVPALPPEQTKNRFHYAFRQFVAAIACAEHPLVLFIDDLQWADLPSLQLLSALVRSQRSLHLLLIGAYRDNEVSTTHPLAILLQDAAQSGTVLDDVTLPPLTHADVAELLRDTFQHEAAVEALAQLCMAKTQGNPFFLNRFLETLVEHNLLYRDQDNGQWQWDIAAIRQADITDNVVDLMLARLQKLPEATQRVLYRAACLGTVFDLRMLALVCELPEADTADLLWEALRDEIIIPLNNHYKYAGQAFGSMTESLMPTYRFLHDRVQQAAGLLSDEAEMAVTHLAIGRIWRTLLPPAEQQEQLFDLANHLNLGRALMTDPAERLELARLNLAAARKAKASTAYRPALMHLQTALELMDEAHWRSEYELMLALHLDAAEASYLTTDFTQMERYVDTALQHAATLLDRVKIHEIPIRAHISQSKREEAIALALQALGMLGVHYPKQPKRYHLLWETARTRWAMRKSTVESMGRLPAMTDEHALAARRISSRIYGTFYRMRPLHYVIGTLKGLRTALEHGVEPSTSILFQCYAIILSSELGNTAQAARYGELALQLLERFNKDGELYKGRTLTVLHGFLRPWTTPLHMTLDGLITAHLQCLEMGDLEFAAYSAILYCQHLLYCGVELDEIEKKTRYYCVAVEQTPGQFFSLRIMWKMMLELMGSSATGSTAEEVMSEQQEKSSRALMQKDLTEMFQMHCFKLMVRYLFQDYEAALEHAHLAEAINIGTPNSLFFLATFRFYDTLTHLALYDSSSVRDRPRMLAKARQGLKKLRRWEKNAPANFSGKCALVEAELARVTGKVVPAMAAYERAIQQSTEHNILHEAALAKELAGAFYTKLGQMRNANAHLREARHDYRLWGALAKVRQLEERYPQHFQERPSEKTRTFSTSPTVQTVSATAIHLPDKLDLATVMKASQALSQEIVLENLLKRLMQVVMENAGAQNGVLLLKKDSEWVLEAQKSEAQEEASVLQSIRIDDVRQEDTILPLSLVQYITRTKESIVTREAVNDKRLRRDPYVERHGPRSVLGMPILHHAELTGILYLENNAVSGAFTENHLEVLHLLTSQIAISIENARLYADMEERVAARTRELEAMALRDTLTGVANRKAFDERLAEEFARSRRSGQPLSLLMIDIDHFKHVNDTFGHLIGDECLKQMGTTLTGFPHRPGDFVARYGGEEFGLVVQNTNLDGAMVLAERVLDAVRGIVLETKSVRHPITVSIGVATAVPEHPSTPSMLIATADRRLYAAKASGRNRAMGTE